MAEQITLYSSNGTINVDPIDTTYYTDREWRTTPLSTTDETNFTPYYGSQKSDNANLFGFKAIKGYLNLLKGDAKKSISNTTIDNILNDQNAIALYINALVYGDYDLNDIYRDVKRKDLVNNGDATMNNIKVIDENKKAGIYKNTTAGKMALSSPALIVPSTVGSIDTSMFNYSVFQMPNEVFTTLVNPINVNSKEYQDEVDKVKAAYYDIVDKQMSAGTEREKALADYEWTKTKELIEKNFNVQLSSNAFQAWDQINALGTAFISKGLGQTGIEAGTINDYLRRLRKSDQVTREGYLTDQEKTKYNYYLTSATPEQIKNDLTEEEQIKLGLKPSAETAAYFTTENLKSVYPDMSDEEIQNIKDSVVDPYGNYRSTTYQTAMENKIKNMQAKKTFQETQVLNKKAEEEARAYAPYKTGLTFSKPAKPTVVPPATTTETTPAVTPVATPEQTELTKLKESVPVGWDIDPITKRLFKSKYTRLVEVPFKKTTTL